MHCSFQPLESMVHTGNRPPTAQCPPIGCVDSLVPKLVARCQHGCSAASFIIRHSVSLLVSCLVNCLSTISNNLQEQWNPTQYVGCKMTGCPFHSQRMIWRVKTNCYMNKGMRWERWRICKRANSMGTVHEDLVHCNDIVATGFLDRIYLLHAT